MKAIEDAARVVVARQGFLRTTVADIAEESGRSVATFYTYFDSKEDLLAHLWEVAMREVGQRAGTGALTPQSPYEWFEASTAAFWDVFVDNVAAMAGVAQMSMLDDHFAARWLRLRERVLRSASSSFAGVDGLDPELAASALTSMFEHFAYLWIAGGGDALPRRRPDRETAIRTLATMWYHTVVGSRGEPPGGRRTGDDGSRAGGDGAVGQVP